MAGLLLAVATLLAGGCSFVGTDEADGPAATTDDGEASDAEAGDADGATGEAASGGAESGDAAAGPAPTGVACELVDGGIFFEIDFVHGGESLAGYKGDVQFYANDAEVHSTFVSVEFVRPAERVKQEFFVSGPADLAIDRCSAELVVAEAPFLLAAQVAALGDVSACENVGPSPDNTFAYELTVTNPSAETPASYEMYVAFLDPDGVRRATRLVLSDNTQGLYEEIEPGASVTETDQTLVLPFADGYTCEVVAAHKLTTSAFFDATNDTGAEVGSLNADLGFATGSAELIDEAFLVLGPVIDRIDGSTPVCVEGYADSVGSDEDNLQLSQARAEAVADYLRAATLADITPVGRGESEATADEVDDPALRRVDITLAACPAG